MSDEDARPFSSPPSGIVVSQELDAVQLTLPRDHKTVWRWLKRLGLVTVIGLMVVLLVPIGMPINERAIQYIGMDLGLPAFNWIVYFVQHLLMTMVWVVLQNLGAALGMLGLGAWRLTGGEGPGRQIVSVLLSMVVAASIGLNLPINDGLALSSLYVGFVVIFSALFCLLVLKEPHSRLVVRAASLEVHNSGEERVGIPLDGAPRVTETTGRPVLSSGPAATPLFSVLGQEQIAWLNGEIEQHVSMRNQALVEEGHDLTGVAQPPETLTDLVDGVT